MIVERFGLFARFGFMHLVATNLSLWVRTIIWESANEWIHHVHRHQGLVGRQQGGTLSGADGSVSIALGNGPIALGLKGYKRYDKIVN